MTKILNRICRRVKFDVPKGRGTKGYSWHAFRHALDTGMQNAGINPIVYGRWMGWVPSKSNMVSHYYSPEEGDLQKVMAKHPFLKFWE
jgi:hypothetical protein